MPEAKTQTEDISKDSKPDNIISYSLLTDRICSNIRDELPHYIGSIPEFEDCSIEYLQQYRVILITPEGLGVDMDRQQYDVNYFQIGEQEISKQYDELEVEYISQRKAKQYQSYGITGLFRTIWSDLTKKLSNPY